MKKIYHCSLVLLMSSLLVACQTTTKESTLQTSSSQSATTSQANTKSSQSIATETDFVKGNDDIGYLTFSKKVIDFHDLDHDESVANTRQWTDPETMGILSLTSFNKSDYTKTLKEAGKEWEGMTEVDLITMINLDAFNGVEGADVDAEQDFFKEYFHDSAISRVRLPNGACIITATFQPKADSQKIYILSTEGSDEKQALSWLGEMVPTWREKP